MTINKKELKYILSATIFALVVFGFIIPKFVSSGAGSSSPYFQFLIFNISIFIFLQFFLKATAVGNGIKISGAVGVISLFMALDILTPPLLVTPQGELLTSVVLSASASDYIAGLLWSNILSGPLVYFATYVITPILLLILAAKLIPNFVRRI